MFFPTDHLPLIKKSIKLSRFSFYEPYPSRKVNTVYFDDLLFSSLEESIVGKSLGGMAIHKISIWQTNPNAVLLDSAKI